MKECLIQGSAEAVIMAQSAIEDRLKTPQTPAIEPQLREFAIKLGYSNQVIDPVSYTHLTLPTIYSV